MILKEDGYTYFAGDGVQWRYKTMMDYNSLQDYFYAEKRYSSNSDYVSNEHMILKNEDGSFRKSMRLVQFERSILDYHESAKRIQDSSLIRSGKKAKIRNRDSFTFNLSNDYKELMIDSGLTISAYIHESIREKLINDGLLQESL